MGYTFTVIASYGGTDDQAPDDQAPVCTVCGGPVVDLGSLGDMRWGRCRNCGWEVATSDERRATKKIS